MRALLHTLIVVMVLPYAALASAFALLGRALHRGALLDIAGTLLEEAAFVVSWGGVAVVVAVLLLVVLGWQARYRWFTAAIVGAVAVVSLLVLVVGHTAAIGSDQVVVLLPCVLVVVAAGWLTATGWPRVPAAANAVR